ncbi:stalk domain-containing protein [uncultured Brevibacillus sp.]|uniref:stalk domain-containing protein n=1 Tax=uncultured Brevibacillus sp. TaxID=169970 RepID=UPI0025933C8F|nr:stalk domain-containing protein [uncultured Brevibacillus sp.]
MNRKFYKISVMFVLALLVSFGTSISTSAAGIKGKELNLIDEKSGYKIIIPNYIETKKVQATDYDDQPFEANVIVMETPKKDSNDMYPIFEIVTSDKSAYSIVSYPGDKRGGQVGNFEGEFKDGHVMYSPYLIRYEDLEKESEGAILSFGFSVMDKNSNEVFSVSNLDFMFVSKANGNKSTNEIAVSATPSSSKVLVNGKSISFDAYNINGNNYFKLRDLAMTLNGTGKSFEVSWDSSINAINLSTDTKYTPDGKELVVSQESISKNAKLTNSKLYLDGKEVQLTAYNIDGNNYFKLRDIAKVINFGVTWDGTSNSIGIDTKSVFKE